MLSELLEWIEEFNPEALLADGFDDAIIGICERFGNDPVVAYDKDKCINILVQRDGMSYEEAVEYFDFNVLGAYVGKGTPVYILNTLG
ncbi:MAG: hypothetical protein COB65_06295 [Thalassobium sp.]|nr:MAG: hypothetical protein COB65_06295 [Thalassobium sp.]